MIERKYIKQLINQVEDAEEFISGLEEETQNLRTENTNLTTRVRDLELELKEQKEINNRLKIDIKRPAKITNPATFDIFKQIKEGGVITFIKPTINGKYKSYESNPFILELDDKKAFFDGTLLGLCELKQGNYHYYSISDVRKPINSEIFRILNISSSYRDECKIRPIGTRGRMAKTYKMNDILKMNPVINIETGKFVTTGKTQFIYQKDDGTEYIIYEDGSEEVV
jgi:regulator of replication initiation timing